MRIALDYDGTLVDANQEWLPGAPDALVILLRLKHKIVVHTCRANWPSGSEQVHAKLKDAGLWPAAVTVWVGAGKPQADLYIDNQAVRFTGDWLGMLGIVREEAKALARSRKAARGATKN